MFGKSEGHIVREGGSRFAKPFAPHSPVPTALNDGFYLRYYDNWSQKQNTEELLGCGKDCTAEIAIETGIEILYRRALSAAGAPAVFDIELLFLARNEVRPAHPFLRITYKSHFCLRLSSTL